MAFTLAERAVRPLTADEVMRMVEAGILSEDEPVELLHGALTEKAVKSPEHEEIKTRLLEWLRAGASERIRVEGAFVVPDRTSMPEPDIAVVPLRDYRHAHPSEALLVIEVAVTSLGTDTQIKPALFAAARVPEYWVVDVPAKRVLVHRGPGPDGYAIQSLAGETVQPLALEVPPLRVAGLFD
jgi:Uma2 family endonuclease